MIQEVHSIPKDLPYFDELLRKLDTGDLDTERMWGSNVHFGFWDDPKLAKRSVSSFVTASSRMNTVLIEKARLKNGLRILDVGCGFGGMIRQLDKRYSNLQLVGLNIDSRQLARAKEKVLPFVKNDVSFVEGDACKMPFQDHSFDVIFAVECIFHFKSRYDFLSESTRILKPGGRIIVSDFVYFAPTQHILNYWISHHRVFQRWGRLTGVSRSAYHILAKTVGLSNLSFEDITANTLPNYQVLFGTPGIQFQTITKLGLIKYMIIDATSKRLKEDMELCNAIN